jgi:replicative DNA helicase
MSDFDNKLPSNEQAEKFVVSAALANKTDAETLLTSLNEDDFTLPQLKYIYEALRILKDKNADLDIAAVAAVLNDTGHFTDIGGTTGLENLLDSYISDEGLEENINIIRDKTNVRNLIVKMRELERNYYGKRYDSDNGFLTIAESDVNKITSNRRVQGFSNLKEISAKIKENIKEAKLSGASLIGYDTGFSSLNRITLGFSKGEMIVIAARPSVGKTALGVNIAYNVARSSGKPVLIFSLEMSDVSLGTRILSSTANVEMKKIMTGTLNSDNLLSIEESIKLISSTPLYIDNTPNIKISDIVLKVKKFKASNPNLAMVLIDYLGLIYPDRKYESKRVEIGAISHQLKALATELQIPVVVISQLSRSVEQRQSKRPEMQDLRESGDIEQDADKVILLYREDYYDNDMIAKRQRLSSKGLNQDGPGFQANTVVEQPKTTAKPVPTDPSMVEVYVAKNRNGETNRCFLWFFKAYSRFNLPDQSAVEDYIQMHKLQ